MRTFGSRRAQKPWALFIKLLHFTLQKKSNYRQLQTSWREEVFRLWKHLHPNKNGCSICPSFSSQFQSGYWVRPHKNLSESVIMCQQRVLTQTVISLFGPSSQRATDGLIKPNLLKMGQGSDLCGSGGTKTCDKTVKLLKMYVLNKMGSFLTSLAPILSLMRRFFISGAAIKHLSGYWLC